MTARFRIFWFGNAAHPGDTISVPAGTIHAIGAGLVIAEIQQRSDTTFRLFDHGRGRELHIEDALAVADAGPADFLVTPTRLTDDADASGFKFALHVRADRPDAKLHLVPGSGTRDLATGCQRQRSGRLVRRDDRRRHFRAVGSGHHSCGQQWPDRPRGVHGPAGSATVEARRHGNNSMKSIQRIAFIGNHLPRRCGIATFTNDLHRAVSMARSDLETGVVAMTDPGRRL